MYAITRRQAVNLSILQTLGCLSALQTLGNIDRVKWRCQQKTRGSVRVDRPPWLLLSLRWVRPRDTALLSHTTLHSSSTNLQTEVIGARQTWQNRLEGYPFRRPFEQGPTRRRCFSKWLGAAPNRLPLTKLERSWRAGKKHKTQPVPDCQKRL